MAPEPDLEARIAELIEGLFNLDRHRTGELLSLLAQCQASQVARIFDCLPDEAAQNCAENAQNYALKRRPWVWTRYWEH
jgi:hypothetical protein